MQKNEYDPVVGDTVARTAIAIARSALYRALGDDFERFARVSALSGSALGGLSLTKKNALISPYGEVKLKDAVLVNQTRLQQHLLENDTSLAMYLARIVGAEISRQNSLVKTGFRTELNGDQTLCTAIESV